MIGDNVLLCLKLVGLTCFTIFQMLNLLKVFFLSQIMRLDTSWNWEPDTRVESTKAVDTIVEGTRA